MNDKEKKASKFWSWFEENSKKYSFINQVEDNERELLLDNFVEALHKYNNNLYFEIGSHPDNLQFELIITAEGIIEYFEDVEYLVENSPTIKGWQIIAFKPPMGVGFKTTYRDIEFDPEKTIFIPLTNEEDSSAIGLSVCYSEYETDKKDTFTNGTYLMLDVLLGEKSAALDIDYVEIVRTPKNIGEFSFMHLSEIEEYIKAKKGGN